MNEYRETFFIIPRRIRDLKGITLGFIDVYETMFQFWNKGLNCFLSNPTISKRTGLSGRQVREALTFLEANGELKRQRVGTRRFLIQPERRIETSEDMDDGLPVSASANNTQVGAGAPLGGRSSAYQVGAGAPTEYKEVEYKEMSVRKDTPTQGDLNIACLQDSKCKQLFDDKFSKIDLTIENLLEDCVMYYALLERPQMVSPHRFRKWIANERVDTYAIKQTDRQFKLWSDLSLEEKKLVSDYKHRLKYADKSELWVPLTNKQIEKAKEILDFLNKSRDVGEISGCLFAI